MTAAVNIAQSGLNNVSFRNRIINGAMVIDQRNAGASVTPASFAYIIDRWKSIQQAGTGKYSVQQNAPSLGSVTPPVGFTNYLGVTSLSAYTVGSTDVYTQYQPIEGFNVADFAWGTASAATITVSFWVRSSLTGTFGGSLQNETVSRAYPFTYTISAANTWEKKTITIAGDTTGTWATTNGTGILLSFGLGVGATYSGTAGAWASGSNIWSATGATSVVGTSGATFYITGVQLEAGTTATPFENRQYGTELALCQRYCQVFTNSETGNQRYSTAGWATATTQVDSAFAFKVTMRTNPSISVDTIANIRLSDGASVITPTNAVIAGAVSNSYQAQVAWTCTGATQYRNYWAEANGTLNTSKITFSAEL
jgi:hypothetical protein